MKQENLDKLKKILSIVLLIFWCFLIFYFSNQPGSVSDVSSGVIVNIIKKIIPGNYHTITFIVRKLAHVSIYFILYLLTFNCFKKFNVSKYAFYFCLLYAISDEIHQLFIVNRSCELRDILIDTTGITLAYLITKKIRKNKEKLAKI